MTYQTQGIPRSCCHSKAGNMGLYRNISPACSLWHLQHCPLSAEPFLQGQHVGPLGPGYAQPPSREPRAAPALPCALTLLQSCPILCPSQRLLRARVCSMGKEKKQQAVGSGVLFDFIQVPLKRSLYKSAHENAEGNAGAAWPLYIFTGTPEKKGGDGNPGHANNLSRYTTIRTSKNKE